MDGKDIGVVRGRVREVRRMRCVGIGRGGIVDLSGGSIEVEWVSA